MCVIVCVCVCVSMVVLLDLCVSVLEHREWGDIGFNTAQVI